MDANIAEDKKATEYLANERTFLAWLRTCIAIISLGFVVAKFNLWLSELARRLDPHMPVHNTGLSMPIGITLMALGGIFAVLAAWHYHLINCAIAKGNVRANRGLVLIATIAVALLAGTMIGYMLLTEKQL